MVPEALDVFECIPLSALTGEGIEELKGVLQRMLEGGFKGDTALLTTARQHRAVTEAMEHASTARRTLLDGGEAELAALELKWAREKISALLGRGATDDMLDALFSQFCIGK